VFYESTLSIINRFINLNVQFTEELLIFFISYKFSINIIIKLFETFNITDELFEIACYSANHDVIKYILENKYIPQKNYYDILLSTDINKNTHDTYFKKVSNLKLKNNIHNCKDNNFGIKKFDYKILNQSIYNIIILLCNYNFYVLNCDYLLYLYQKYGIVINDSIIKQQNIIITKKFILDIYKLNYELNYITDETIDIQFLENICDYHISLNRIKYYIKKSGILPNEKCINNLSKNPLNLFSILEYFDTINVYITKNNLEVLVNNISRINLLKKVVRLYLKQNTIENNKINNKIIELNNIISHLKINQVENNVEGNIEETVEETVESTEEGTVVDNVEGTVEETVEDNVEGTVEDNVEKNKKDIDKYIKKIKNSIDINDKIKLKIDILNIFNIKDENTLLTLFEFKNLLILYFYKNNYIKKDSFIIKLKKNFCKLINFSRKKYGKKIDFRNIDLFCKYILEKNKI
jgi:hypothetical protein